MHRIDDPTAVASLPAPRPPGVPGYFTGGAPGSGGFAATVVRYEFMNSLQEEIATVIERSGIVLDKNDNAQMFKALQRLFVFRTLVTKPTTIYVNPAAGADSNDGMTAGTAVKTIRQAIVLVYYHFDWNNFPCTIQLADGTYNANTTPGDWEGVFFGTPFGLSQGTFTLLGNPNQPQNVVISATNANCIAVMRCQLYINGVSFAASGNINTIYQYQGHGVSLNSAAWVDLQNCHFMSCAYQVSQSNSSVVTLSGAGNSFTGTAIAALYCDVGGMIYFPGATLNVTALTVTGGFAMAYSCGVIDAPSASFIGAGTVVGPRYQVAENGVIATNGGGANYFPGSTPGVSASGGQYN